MCETTSAKMAFEMAHSVENSAGILSGKKLVGSIHLDNGLSGKHFIFGNSSFVTSLMAVTDFFSFRSIIISQIHYHLIRERNILMVNHGTGYVFESCIVFYTCLHQNVKMQAHFHEIMFLSGKNTSRES